MFSLQTAGRQLWGVQIKREWGTPKGAAKCCTYVHREAPKLHYQPPLGRGTVVIVEDMLSAIKLSRVIPTVCILGTHLSEECAVDLHRYYDTLILALDYDAVEKARKLKATWECIFDISITILRQDVKDIPLSHLQEVFGN